MLASLRPDGSEDKQSVQQHAQLLIPPPRSGLLLPSSTCRNCAVTFIKNFLKIKSWDPVTGLIRITTACRQVQLHITASHTITPHYIILSKSLLMFSSDCCYLWRRPTDSSSRRRKKHAQLISDPQLLVSAALFSFLHAFITTRTSLSANGNTSVQDTRRNI